MPPAHLEQMASDSNGELDLSEHQFHLNDSAATFPSPKQLLCDSVILIYLISSAKYVKLYNFIDSA